MKLRAYQRISTSDTLDGWILLKSTIILWHPIWQCFLALIQCLWEQACACGLPGLFKDWHGMHHVNVNGSAEFLKEDSAD